MAGLSKLVVNLKLCLPEGFSGSDSVSGTYSEDAELSECSLGSDTSMQLYSSMSTVVQGQTVPLSIPLPVIILKFRYAMVS